MSTAAAAQLAMTINFITLIILAVWRFAPWSAGRSLVDAMWPLVAIHTGRTVALQLYSSQANGYDISDGVRDQIIWGDQLGAVLAVATLLALWKAPALVRPAGWALVIVTVIDLANALVAGIRNDLLGEATDVSWLILTFYVPLLWVSIGLIAWLLATRADESRTAGHNPREEMLA